MTDSEVHGIKYQIDEIVQPLLDKVLMRLRDRTEPLVRPFLCIMHESSKNVLRILYSKMKAIRLHVLSCL